MFIDLLTSDDFKRNINRICFGKIQLLSVPPEQLQVGIQGHLVQAVDDQFIELLTDKKSSLPFSPEKVLGNFLIFSNYQVSVMSISDMEVILKVDGYGRGSTIDSWTGVLANQAAFNKLEYNSIWWILPDGTKL